MSTRQQGRHNKQKRFCQICQIVVRSLPRHNRRHHSSEEVRDVKQQQPAK